VRKEEIGRSNYVRFGSVDINIKYDRNTKEGRATVKTKYRKIN
jgi:hypothetical protein